MGVRFNGRERRPRNRRNGYNAMVRKFAPLLMQLQAKGYISASAIRVALAEVGATNTKGLPYAESTIFAMLKRASELGFPVIRRTRSEAAGAWIRSPRPPRNSQKKL